MTRSLIPVANQVIVADELSLNGSIEKALIKLLDGTYSQDFEKLPPSKLYSMRTEQKGRIILVKSVIEGITTLIALEFLADHEYHRSTCLQRLNNQQLSRKIQKHAEGTLYVLGPEGKVLIAKIKEPSAPSKRAFIEYGDLYLEPTEAQQNAAVQEPEYARTKIIFGEAGSGKTLVLMQLLSSLASILATDEDATRKLWVIVPHLHLARHLRDEWSNQMACREITVKGQRDPVQIVTPEMLYRLLDHMGDEVSAQYANDFLTWLSSDNRIKISQLVDNLSPMQIYQELCIINGLSFIEGPLVDETKALYLKPELKQAFLTSANRSATYTVLKSLLNEYVAYLNQNNAFDPNLYQLQTPLPSIDFYFFDEAQNLPPGLLKAPNSVIAMNDSQSLLFKRRVNEILIRSIKKDHEFVELPGSHRSPQQQIDLAAKVDYLIANYIKPNSKHAITSKPIITSNPNLGLICFAEGTAENEILMLQQMVQEPDTAVVYLNEEAEVEFKQKGIIPLCEFNKKNPILGLEFKRIILVSPFSLDLIDVNNLILEFNQAAASEELPPNRITELELYFNGLKAAVTRSTETLVLVQKKAHGIEALVSYFTTKLWSSLQLLGLDPQERIAAFYKQAGDLYQQGQYEMAFNIIKLLKLSVEDFKKDRQPKSLNNLANPSKEQKPQKLDTPPKIEAKTPKKLVAVEPLEPKLFSADKPFTYNLAPLGPKLSTNVELFFNNLSLDSLEKLFTDPKSSERAAYILFHHKMLNGYCLFLNACFNNKIKIFLDLENKNKELYAKFQMAYSTIPKENYFLRLVLGKEMTPISTAKKAKFSPQTHPIFLSISQVQEIGLGSLFLDGKLKEQLPKVTYLLRKFNNLTEQNLTHRWEQENGTIFPSFLHVLSTKGHEWVQFWNKNKQYSVERCFRSLFATENKPSNTLFILHQFMYSGPEGYLWICNRLNLIAPLLSEKIAWTQYHGEEEIAYGYSFFAFYSKSNMFLKNWQHLKKHLTEEGFNALITNKNEHDLSTFHLFCLADNGLEILKKYPQDFTPYIRVEELFKSLRDLHWPSPPPNAFFNLCSTELGIETLKALWPYLKKNPQFIYYLSVEFFEVSEVWGNPFIRLAGTESGVELLDEYWDDFLPHLNSLCLLRPIKLTSFTKDTGFEWSNIFHLLCSHKRGSKLLYKRAQDLKHLITEGLDNNHESQRIGYKSFFWFCAYAEGRGMLQTWDDFYLLLDIEALFTPYSLKNDDLYGKTLFEFLYFNKEGETILKLWNINPQDERVPPNYKVLLYEFYTEKVSTTLERHGVFARVSTRSTECSSDKKQEVALEPQTSPGVDRS